MKRGLLPFLLLHLLAERPRHGYDFMREFKERGGRFRPGPGSIYPTLAALEEAGFVKSRDEGGKRVYVITEEGIEHMKSHAGGFEGAFVDEEHADPATPVRDTMHKLHAAVHQAVRSTPETVDKVLAILNGARKEIYTLLANE
ncbi:MAG: PadR family transcriptional regulator [Candidatus Baltobacteraceae bacterium]